MKKNLIKALILLFLIQSISLRENTEKGRKLTQRKSDPRPKPGPRYTSASIHQDEAAISARISKNSQKEQPAKKEEKTHSQPQEGPRYTESGIHEAEKLFNLKGKPRTLLSSCPNGWKYFLGGILFNYSAELVDQKKLFGDINAEQCLTDIASNLWKLSDETTMVEEEKGNGFIKFCTKVMCYTVKFFTKALLAGLISYYTGMPEIKGYDLADKSIELTSAFLKNFWQSKAVGAIQPVLDFLEKVNIPGIAASIYNCFIGNATLRKALYYIGLKIVDYAIDNFLVDIAKAILPSNQKTVISYAANALNYLGLGDIPAVKSMKHKVIWSFISFGASMFVKFTKIGQVVNKYFINGSAEVFYLVFNLGLDIKNLYSEKNDCRKMAYWGKIFYKSIRLLKIYNVGPGGNGSSTDDNLDTFAEKYYNINDFGF